MNAVRPLAALTAATLLVAACSGGGDDSSEATVESTAPETAAPTTTEAAETTTTSSSTTTSSTSSTTTTTMPATPRQPLTGEPIESEDQIEQKPALAVKIDNAPAARRNHTGLAVADIVFEEIVEASITRFAAVFHSTGSDPVGPIRSGRTQDIGILASFRKPLFAWSGGNPGVTAAIRDTPFLVDLNWQTHGGAYWRGPGATPHNLYSTTDTLWGLTPPDSPGAPPQQYQYLEEGESFEGEPSAGLDLDMDAIDVQWEWNADEGKFARSQEGGPHLDTQSGQIMATNVVVMVLEYRPSAVDERSPEAQTIGEGPLFVWSDGQVVTGRWRRAAEDGLKPFQFLDEDGEPIELQPGNTWIELARALESGDPANPDVALEVFGPPESDG
jgi:hypothetical protein